MQHIIWAIKKKLLKYFFLIFMIVINLNKKIKKKTSKYITKQFNLTQHKQQTTTKHKNNQPSIYSKTDTNIPLQPKWLYFVLSPGTL